MLDKKTTKQLKELREKLKKCWCRETVWHESDYDPDCPSYGQCYVTALLIQNIFGGNLIAGTVDGESHYWNKIPDGTEVDLTSDQFDGGDGIHPHLRREDECKQRVTNDDRKCGRYLLLRKKYYEETNRY